MYAIFVSLQFFHIKKNLIRQKWPTNNFTGFIYLLKMPKMPQIRSLTITTMKPITISTPIAPAFVASAFKNAPATSIAMLPRSVAVYDAV